MKESWVKTWSVSSEARSARAYCSQREEFHHFARVCSRGAEFGSGGGQGVGIFVFGDESFEARGVF